VPYLAVEVKLRDSCFGKTREIKQKSLSESERQPCNKELLDTTSASEQLSDISLAESP
jgi:hypothetical protein